MKLNKQTTTKKRSFFMGFFVPIFLIGVIYSSLVISAAFHDEHGNARAIPRGKSSIEDSGEIVSFKPLLNTSEIFTRMNKSKFSGFVQNDGQVADPDVLYYLQGKDQWIGFESSSVRFVTWGINGTGKETLRLDFPGGNLVEPCGTGVMAHFTNYFIGSSQYTDVPSYGEIWYHDLYDGIDLRYYMAEQGLKYEFVLDAGVDPSLISMHFSTNAVLEVTPDNITAISRVNGQALYKESALNVYQGAGELIPSAFLLDEDRENAIRFVLASYDPGLPTVIDPLITTFSTYIGGASYDYAYDVAADEAKNIYLTGCTTSVDFPTKKPYMGDPGDASYDAFVMKFYENGSLAYSTYIGGSSLDRSNQVAVGNDGNVYITGSTQSPDFPLVNAAYPIRPGGTDAFVTKLNATGNGLVFSTYLGGSGTDLGNAIDVDPSGCAFVGGDTYSADFPKINSYKSTSGSDYDVFIARFTQSGNTLIYSTIIGGSNEDGLFDIDVDDSGYAYITGRTYSTNYPCVNQIMSDPGDGTYDAFVTKVGISGNTLVYSTYLGGDSTDYGNGIAVDSSGYAYVTGDSSSVNFPTQNAYDASKNSSSDGFVSKLSVTGNSLVFSTFFGGLSTDAGKEIDVCPTGEICVAFSTRSPGMPLVNAFQGRQTDIDTMVVRFTSAGNSLVFSTYLGSPGAGDDSPEGLAIIDGESVAVCGWTTGTTFPLWNPYQSDQGSDDAFLTKLVYDVTAPSINLVSPANGTRARSSATIHVTATDSYLSTFQYRWVGVSGWFSLAPDAYVNFCPVEGPHILSLMANDSSGNTAIRNYTFITDNTGPAWNTGILPANNTWHSTNPILDLEFMDAAGINNGCWDVDDATPDNILFSGASGTTWSQAGWQMDNLTWEVLPEGWHVLYFSASDDLNNIVGESGEWRWRFGKDSMAPAAPSPTSPSHQIGVWNSSNVITMQWTLPTDFGGSGIAGYSCSWTNGSSADPGTTITTTGLTVNSIPLGTGRWYFNIRASDNTGNWSTVASLGPFLIDITPPAPIQNLHSLSHVISQWSNDGTVDLAWDAATDGGGSGIAGYSYTWMLIPMTPDFGIDGNSTTCTSGSLGNSQSWFFNIIAIDLAGNPSTNVWIGPFWIDTSPPSAPAPWSTTHSFSVWSNASIINMTWPVANDTGGSGIAGYAVSFTIGASDPGTTITTNNTWILSTSLFTGNNWYFNLRCRDNAGSWSGVRSVGPYYIDVEPPAAPSPWSPTHAPSTWSSTTIVNITWSMPSDGDGSGVAGYSYAWTNDSPADPGTSIMTTARTINSTALGSGTWYFNIRASDNTYKWSTVASLGPFLIDATPPAAVQNLHSISHIVSQWSNDTWIDLAWDVASDMGGSGIAGYSYTWATSPVTPGSTVIDNSTTHTGWRPAGNSWYFCIIAIDGAGSPSPVTWIGPFWIDNSPPSPPSPASTTHSISVWSINAIINMTWIVPGDVGGSGIAGYATSFTVGAANPGTAVTTTSTSVLSPSLSTGNAWYFNIRSRDGAGSWSAVTSVGPFFIDTDPPAAPAPASPTHVVSTWSMTTVINVTWISPSDNGSGIAGYSYSWTRGAHDPGTTLMTSFRTLLSPALTDANDWYFNIRSVDMVGLWSSITSLGPFYIDGNSPAAPSPWSPTHAPLTWSSTTVVNITWSMPSDWGGSGVVNFSYSWTRGPQVPGTTPMTSLCSLLSAPLADANDWYFNIRAVDAVGQWSSHASLGPFRIDTQAPGIPSPTSSTHVQSTWSAIPVISVSWSNPGDSDGSGVAGYSVSWTHGAAVPDSTIDTASTSTSSSPLGEGTDWYFNIAAIDGVGMVSSSASIGPFYVDVTPPSAPVPTSNTHVVGVPSMTNIINVSWSATSDGNGSGVVGYSYSWTRGVQGVDNATEPYGLSALSPVLASANDYYFNIRAVDAVGHGSVIFHLGPFWITSSSLYPTATGPLDQSFPQNTGDRVLHWTLFDPYGVGGQYRILLDGTPATNWTAWTTGMQINFTIHTTVAGVYNYTAEFNNTLGYSGRDTVIITITQPASPFNLALIIVLCGVAFIGIVIAAMGSRQRKKIRAKKAKLRGSEDATKKRPAVGKAAPTGVMLAKGKLPGMDAKAGVEVEQPAQMTEKDRAEMEKTEKEVQAFETQHICVVHKGPIAGAIFLCPKCKVFYCMTCALVLKQKGEKCWSCGADIAIDIPQPQSEEAGTGGDGGGDAQLEPKPVDETKESAPAASPPGQGDATSTRQEKPPS
ncbi:MAG: SBBP repeat-containing protein [Candidatus Sigynarchaeota archaeon]